MRTVDYCMFLYTQSPHDGLQGVPLDADAQEQVESAFLFWTALRERGGGWAGGRTGAESERSLRTDRQGTRLCGCGRRRWFVAASVVPPRRGGEGGSGDERQETQQLFQVFAALL